MEYCPECREELSEDGLCPVCMLAGGISPFTSTEHANMPVTAVAEPNSIAEQAGLEYDSFGPYSIVGLIGEGGMGTVYLARQNHPIQREVALKVIRPGMDTKQILARFDYERRALAMMDHPNIARVFDASATAMGRPYFVMEYIHGEPITTYCDSQRMNTRERLKLFLPVCEALQHAHQKGILHRDIKPSNVLVTKVDGRPIPKVIDFGIAKATEHVQVAATAFTQFGQLVGTPEYMSPEAADVVNNDVDTTSDVYSLGVLLYELLVGAVPFDGKTLRKAGLLELMRIIREVENPALTAKLTQLGKTATEVAELRSTSPLGLRRELAGDLNSIVMKAVDKSRERRYPTAAELSGDIQRHLDDLPVKATPPSWTYQFKKFVKRNRRIVFAGSAIAATLVIGIVATLWQARVAGQERAEAIWQRAQAEKALGLAELHRREAEEQRSVALRQEATAQANLADVRSLANSMLFELEAKVKDLAGSTGAREALVRLGTQYLTKAGNEDPMLGAAHFRMGELQGIEGLRDSEGAKASYRQSAEKLEEQLRRAPGDREARRLLGLAYLRQAQLQDSEAAQNTGYARSRKTLQPLVAVTNPDIEALHAMAQVLVASKEYALAVEMEERVAAAGARTAADLAQLARVQLEMGNWLSNEDAAKALLWHEKALLTIRQVTKLEPANASYQIQAADVMRSVALQQSRLNRYEEALQNARRAVAIGDDFASKDPNQASFQVRHAQSLAQLATLLRESGQTEVALQQMSRAIAIQKEQMRRYPKVEDFALEYVRLSIFAMAAPEFLASDFAQAASSLREVETIVRGVVARTPQHKPARRLLSLTLCAQGETFINMRDFASAMRKNSECIEVARQLVASDGSAEDWRQLGRAHASHGFGLVGMGRFAEGILAYRAAVESCSADLSRSPRSEDAKQMLAFARFQLAQTFASRGDHRSAIATISQGLPMLEADYAARPNEYAVMRRLWLGLFVLRHTYVNVGELENGLAASRRSLQIARRIASGNPEDPSRMNDLLASMVNLSSDLIRAGQRMEGLEVTSEGLRTIAAIPFARVSSDEIRRGYVDNYLYFVRGLVSSDEPEEAVPHGIRAIAMAEEILKKDPQNLAKKRLLESAYRDTASALQAVGQLAEGQRMSETALQLVKNEIGASADYWFRIALYEIQIGSLADRSGRRDEAHVWWKRALVSLETGRSIAGKAYGSDLKNLAALTNLNSIEWRMALVNEFLGQGQQARNLAESALARIKKLVEAAPADHSKRQQLQAVRGFAFRVVRQADGAGADFQPLIPGEKVTQDRIDDEVEAGFRATAGLMGADYYKPEQRLKAAERAVATGRALVGRSGTPVRQFELARSLNYLSQALIACARLADQVTAEAHMRLSVAASHEALETLLALQRGNLLSERDLFHLREARQRLGDAQARMQKVLNAKARASQP